MEKNFDNRKFIESIPVFKSFSLKAIAELAKMAHTETTKQGEYIFIEGDPASGIFIIIDGEVTILKNIAPDKEKILSVFGPKSVFGEMGIFTDLVRTASARAKTDTLYLKIEIKPFKKIYKIDPEGTQKLIEHLLLSTLGRLEQTSRELATVYEISKTIAKDLTAKDFCRETLMQICYSIPNADIGAFYLWNEFSDEFDLSAEVSGKGFRDALGKEDVLVKYIIEKNPCKETFTFSINSSFEARRLLGEKLPTHNVLVTTLCKESAILGFIILANNKERILFSSSINDLMNSIASQVAEAIQNIKKKEEDVAKKRLDRTTKGSVTW